MIDTALPYLRSRRNGLSLNVQVERRTEVEYRHQEFIIEEGRLRYFQSLKVVPVVETPLARHQLCQLMFGRDGSIYVDFPYFRDQSGIVSRVNLPDNPSGPVTLDLKDGGRASSHQVKFSHHARGEALFSKDGKVLTQIRKPSFVLADSIGHLFHLHAYWLSGFELLTEENRKNKLYLPSRFESELPTGVTMVAHWRRKRDILDNVAPANGQSTVGPMPMAFERSTGRRTTFFLVGQPSTSPLQDHLILLETYGNQVPRGVDRSTMIFLGGWDPHEVNPPGLGAGAPPTGFLTFMYPVGDLQQLEDAIGTIDYLREGDPPESSV